MAGGHGKHRQFHEGCAVRSHHDGVGTGMENPCNVLVALDVGAAMNSAQLFLEIGYQLEYAPCNFPVIRFASQTTVIFRVGSTVIH